MPLIISWPDKIKKSLVSEEMTSSIDFLPTILSVTNSGLNDKGIYDGIDISPLFSEEKKLINRNELYWHYPHYHIGSGMEPATAIRWKNYKLIQWHEATILNQEKQIELYNLKLDPAEENDLSKIKPEIAILMSKCVCVNVPKVNSVCVCVKNLCVLLLVPVVCFGQCNKMCVCQCREWFHKHVCNSVCYCGKNAQK